MTNRVPLGASTKNTEERARSWDEIQAEGCLTCKIPQKYCKGLETKEECEAYYNKCLAQEEARKRRAEEEREKDRERYAQKKAQQAKK